MAAGTEAVPFRATVVICTRGRGDKIVATVESVLSSSAAEFELLIIDQSVDDSTLDALRPFMADTRVRYVRSTETGVARSRSLALTEARSEYLLNTDDDCVVAHDWIEANIAALDAHPNAGIVFGDVISPPVADAGYAPESVAARDFVVTSIWSWKTTDGANVGIGASMAMRRSVLAAIGGFDHRLGPGSALRNAEDTDVTVRVLLAGHDVVRTTRARVDHYGHRPHTEFRELTRGAMLGLGAVCGKVIRRHPLAGAWLIAGLYWRMVVKVAVRDLARLRKPPVLGRAVFLAKGLARGLRIPLQRSRNLLFASDDRSEIDATPPRPTVAFITEQHVGLRTYSENLRRFADRDPRIDAVWVPVAYNPRPAWWQRLPLPEGVRGALSGRAEVRQAIARNDPDVCLFMTQVPAAIGGRRARRRPYVIMADDTPILFDAMAHHYDIEVGEPRLLSALKRRINTAALRSAHRVLPMSEWARRSVIDDYGVDPDRARVVPTGIDLEAWRRTREPHDGPVRVLFVGGDFARKGGDLLLAAYERLPAGMAELHVVTRSPVAPTEALHVYPSMQANSPELIALFNSCDVFVLPSRGEAFPNVVVEACASGLPCIVTDVGGMAEMVTDGETGFVVEPDDPSGLADRLVQLCSDPELRARMGTAARRRAEADFDGAKNAHAVVDELLAAALTRR